MALRTIRTEGDPVLRKVSKPVKEVTPKIVTLVDDMLDTMYEAMGVGLAAPQVGILKRIVVIDIGDGPIVLINPEVLEILRRTDRRRRMLKRSGHGRTGDPSELCQSKGNERRHGRSDLRRNRTSRKSFLP